LGFQNVVNISYFRGTYGMKYCSHSRATRWFWHNANHFAVLAVQHARVTFSFICRKTRVPTLNLPENYYRSVLNRCHYFKRLLYCFRQKK